MKKAYWISIAVLLFVILCIAAYQALAPELRIQNKSGVKIELFSVQVGQEVFVFREVGTGETRRAFYPLNIPDSSFDYTISYSGEELKDSCGYATNNDIGAVTTITLDLDMDIKCEHESKI